MPAVHQSYPERMSKSTSLKGELDFETTESIWTVSDGEKMKSCLAGAIEKPSENLLTDEPGEMLSRRHQEKTKTVPEESAWDLPLVTTIKRVCHLGEVY